MNALKEGQVTMQDPPLDAIKEMVEETPDLESSLDDVVNVLGTARDFYRLRNYIVENKERLPDDFVKRAYDIAGIDDSW